MNRSEWPQSIPPYRHYVRVKGGIKETGEKPPPGTVAIVMPVRNGLKFFKLCFYSIMDFTDVPFMVQIVDHLGNLDTKKLLNTLTLNHQIYVERYDEEEFNFSRQVNLGIKKAFEFPQVQYAVVINADTVVEPLWLTKMMRVMEANPRVGIVGPMSNAANPEQMEEAKKENIWLAQRLSGFCMLFRREVWEQLGGFDESFVGGGFEDWDFCERARRAGWHAMIDGFTHVHHFYKMFHQNDYDAHMRLNQERFFKKHPLLMDLVRNGDLVKAS